MSFLHQKPARRLLAASALGLLVIVSAVFATSALAFSHSFALSLDGYSKDLIPTGNALRASDPTQPPVLQRFATASSQQNPPTHSSGRISSTEEVTVGLQHAPVGSTNLKWNATTRDLTVTIVMSGLAPDSTHPAHIHQGDCNSNGPIKYMLNDVKGDKRRAMAPAPQLFTMWQAVFQLQVGASTFTTVLV